MAIGCGNSDGIAAGASLKRCHLPPQQQGMPLKIGLVPSPVVVRTEEIVLVVFALNGDDGICKRQSAHHRDSIMHRLEMAENGSRCRVHVDSTTTSHQKNTSCGSCVAHRLAARSHVLMFNEAHFHATARR
jgi:hypothetical protein